MHTIGSRLNAWRDSLGLNQKQAAAKLGMSPSSYQNYERDVRSPAVEALAKFRAGGIDLNWLVTGNGVWPSNAAEAVIGEASGMIPPPPLALAQASGQFQVSGKSAGGVESGQLPTFSIDGDSMRPTLLSGWSVRFDPQRTAVAAGLYVVKLGGSILVRRLEARPGGGMRVSADNPAYQSYDLDPEKLASDGLEVLGAVVWAGGPIE